METCDKGGQRLGKNRTWYGETEGKPIVRDKHKKGFLRDVYENIVTNKAKLYSMTRLYIPFQYHYFTESDGTRSTSRTQCD